MGKIIANLSHFITSGNNSSEYSNERIIEGICNNSNETLEYIYKSYYSKIKKMVWAFRNTVLQPEDIFQEGLTRAVVNIQNGEFRGESSFYTYLNSVCRNVCRKELEKHRYSELNSNVEVEDESENFELLQALLKVLKRLDDKCRDIIELRFNLGNNADEPIQDDLNKTYVEQEANLTVESGKSRFNIIGTTKVKGEWVETIDEPKFTEGFREIKGDNGKQMELWITCNIKGRAKEATPKANIETYTLSYPNAASKSFTFHTGDNLYLYFKSPVNGYLSVYLDDGKNIYKILPYNDMTSESCVKVIADKEYVFFSKSKEHNYFGNSIDELELFTPLKIESNKIHVLFSESIYQKPMLTEAKVLEGDYLRPKSLSRQQCADWIAETKATLDDFIDQQINITIVGEK